MKEHVLTDAVVTGGSRRPGVIDRMAVQLVNRQLSRLQSGRLTVVGPSGRQVFGRPGGVSATVRVADPAAYRRLLTGGTLAAARAYVRGDWTTDDLPAVCRLFVADAALACGFDGGWARPAALIGRLLHVARRNTRRGSRRNIEAHYDLGNDFFQLFLDDTMSYSCGVFEGADTTLRDASLAKIDRICRALELGSGDHLLEIGAGWGGLAMRAASSYGCRVTTATISREQYDMACRRVREAGLADRVTVLLSDYRDLTGVFDQVISVEMIEAVGAGFLDTFFGVCAARVRPGGRVAIQAITVPDARYQQYLRSVDFIEQDVFPGSRLVSVGAMRQSAERAGLALVGDAEELTPHYARTLHEWRARFLDRLDDVRRLGYPEEFIRRWDFYLCACAAGFAEGATGLVQIVFVRPGDRREAR